MLIAYADNYVIRYFTYTQIITIPYLIFICLNINKYSESKTKSTFLLKT